MAALRLEDYALVGDTHTAALVGRDGSVDWLCMPRFDSGAVFARIVGDDRCGRWLVAPDGGGLATSRSYRGDSLVLDTVWRTPDGEVLVTDLMPVRSDGPPALVRIVEGRSGHVGMTSELAPRFDYGHVTPWVRGGHGAGQLMVAGPEALRYDASVSVDGDGHDRDQGVVRSRFTVSAGQRVSFVVIWFASTETVPAAFDDPHRTLDDTVRWWHDWAGRCRVPDDARRADVLRSLLTLKALTYSPSGGIVAAATTSLPEALGGSRNWDYRYCWLRDATFTLVALQHGGYHDEAAAWRDWLLRAVAGDPQDLQIMYGLAGERRLPEAELHWLPGYQGATPVRIGNAAVHQHQTDVYGEVIDALHRALEEHLPASGADPVLDDEVLVPRSLAVQQALLDYLEGCWRDPDSGMWEVRGQTHRYTYGKVMSWVAADRAVRALQQFDGHDDLVRRWSGLREEIHRDVCENGFDADRNTFVQYYGGSSLDSALLRIPTVGFLPASDPRVLGTVDAARDHLMEQGFLRRYDMDDGLGGHEASFLACTFWYATACAMAGRRDDAEQAYARVVGVASDVGLLSEEYDVPAGRLVGNMPQAFSHVGLVNAARALSRGRQGGAQADRPGSG